MKKKAMKKPFKEDVSVLKKEDVTKTIYVPQAVLSRIQKYLTEEPKTEEECLSEKETILYSCQLSDRYEADIKCCGVQYREGESNLAWTEAVLFKNGCEVCCTEPSDQFEGEWILHDGDNTFTVIVEPCIE